MKRQLTIAALALAALVATATVADAGERKPHPKTAAGVEAIDRGDYAAAFELFRTQAAKGDPEAQFELGMLYALGKGAEKDYIAAWMWTEIAARQKEPYADFIRDEVAANMTTGQISEARQRANAWMRQNGYGAFIPTSSVK